MQSSSHLTRRVFRAIVAGQPLRSPACTRQTTTLRVRRSRHKSFQFPQRRTLFGFSANLPSRPFKGAKVTSKNIELALGKLIDLVRARRTQSRIPDETELVDALRFLFLARSQSPTPMTRNETFLATETFNYLQERNLVLNSNEEAGLSKQDLQNVLLALSIGGGKDRFRSDSRALATTVFGFLKQKNLLPFQAAESTDPAIIASLGDQVLLAYATILARTGSSTDALSLLRSSGSASSTNALPVWIAIIKGLANESRTGEVWEVLEEMRNVFDGVEAAVQEDLVTFFVEKDDVDSAEKVFALKLRAGTEPTTGALARMISAYTKVGRFESGAPIVKMLRSRSDVVEATDTLLLWYAARNPEIVQVERAAFDLTEDGAADVLSMRAFNKLVQYAYAQGKPALARDYVELAKSLGLRPDAGTYVLQLEYEVRNGDLHAAAQTYDLLTFEDIPEDRSDVPALNSYIVALSHSDPVQYELLMRVVDSALESKADLSAEALAGLCRVFILRDDLEEATSLLRHRVDLLPGPERARIAAVFREFILDKSLTDQRVWNIYELYRHAFPETSVEDRFPLMRAFFDRERSDLGCLVFGHMRQREDLQARPTPQAYAQCFEGIARCKDVDGLQMVYNMLKLDREVEQTTRIRNAMIQAYTACQLPFTAIIDNFWKILDSREGPTLSSFALALRACETWVPQGGQEARRILALMQKWDLIITKELYDCYIGALAGQSEFENVVELIEHMEKDIGEAPDAVTIGTFYNAIPWQYRKDEVEAWATKTFPDLWEGLLTYGDEIDEEWEIRYFKIDRTIDVEDDPLFSKGQYTPELAQLAHLTLEHPQE